MQVLPNPPESGLAPPAAPAMRGASVPAASTLLRDFDERVLRLSQSIALAAEAACRGDDAAAACQVPVPAVPLPPHAPTAGAPDATPATGAAERATRDIAEVAAAIACMGRQWTPGATAAGRELLRMECEVVGGPWAGTRFVQQPGGGPDASLEVSLPRQVWRHFERRRTELIACLPDWLRRSVVFRRHTDASTGPAGAA